jgi:WS/DGAT/MGAT family acyltransferase
MKLPEGVSPSSFIGSLKEFMSARLHLVPYTTRKLAYTPGNFDHPVWVSDPDFDINNHVIELPVPAPGDRAALERSIADIHSVKMPKDRPLWALYVLTGLEDGSVAYYNQAHHAAVDGAYGNAAYDILMDETPDHAPVAAPSEPARHVAVTSLDLIEESFFNFMRFQLDAGKRLMGSMDTSRRLLERTFDASKSYGAFGKIAPPTPFNTQISEKRSWSSGELPLADIIQMGKTVGATVNDIDMAICAGALRSYLERTGDLPAESLIAGCPVSLRKPGDTTPGNQVSMMNVELATHIADPLDRIAAIQASAATAKGLTADLAGVFEGNAAMPGMPALMSASIEAAESWGLAQFFRGPVNVVISNVPGPRKALYSNGAQMQTHYPVSIPAHGLGLNITVQSYVDQMYIGITACGKAVPEAGLLRDDMLAAYAELKALLLPDNVSELKPRAPMAAISKAATQHSSQNPVIQDLNAQSKVA